MGSGYALALAAFHKLYFEVVCRAVAAYFLLLLTLGLVVASAIWLWWLGWAPY